jgi:hypothetical protein
MMCTKPLAQRLLLRYLSVRMRGGITGPKPYGRWMSTHKCNHCLVIVFAVLMLGVTTTHGSAIADDYDTLFVYAHRDTKGHESPPASHSSTLHAIPDEITPGRTSDQVIERFRFLNTYGSIRPDRQSLVQRIWDWIRRFFNRLPQVSGVDFLMYLIAGALVTGLLIFGIYRAGFRTWFRQNAVSAGYRDVASNASADRIHPQEWLDRGDYRMAIRTMLISALQHLAAGGHINLHKNKTNRDYQIELGNRPEQDSFAHLTRIYAWVWYGGFEPDKAQIRAATDAWQTLTQTKSTSGEAA